MHTKLYIDITFILSTSSWTLCCLKWQSIYGIAIHLANRLFFFSSPRHARCFQEAYRVPAWSLWAWVVRPGRCENGWRGKKSKTEKKFVWGTFLRVIIWWWEHYRNWIDFIIQNKVLRPNNWIFFFLTRPKERINLVGLYFKGASNWFHFTVFGISHDVANSLDCLPRDLSSCPRKCYSSFSGKPC